MLRPGRLPEVRADWFRNGVSKLVHDPECVLPTKNAVSDKIVVVLSSCFSKP